jgi:hypothetical protein
MLKANQDVRCNYNFSFRRKALDPRNKNPLPPLYQQVSRLIEKKLVGPND